MGHAVAYDINRNDPESALSEEIEIIDDLLSMPTKARAALLISALDAMQQRGMAEIVLDTKRCFPDIAPPQLMQQTLLMLMAYARVGSLSAAHALAPTAIRTGDALCAHLGTSPARRGDPLAFALWGLVESLFPDDEGVPSPIRDGTLL